MQEQTINNSVGLTEKTSGLASKGMTMAATFWFQIAALGQLMFVYYIVAFYYTSTAQGNFDKWNKVLPDGYIQGDIIGNLFLLTHLILAAVISFGGFVQLMPQIRKRAIGVHKWNGRVYVMTALIMSISGIYLSLSRGSVGGTVAQVGIGLDGILIMIFAVLTWRYAMTRKIQQHQRWALRLFMVVSGVWFFRVGLMLWLMVHGKPVGFDPKTFTGPFLTFLNFGCYLVPLFVLELYFWTKRRATQRGQWAMVVTLIVCSLMMGGGIIAATMGMWLPRI